MKRYLKYIIMGIVAVTLYTLFFPGKDKEGCVRAEVTATGHILCFRMRTAQTVLK